MSFSVRNVFLVGAALTAPAIVAADDADYQYDMAFRPHNITDPDWMYSMVGSYV